MRKRSAGEKVGFGLSAVDKGDARTSEKAWVPLKAVEHGQRFVIDLVHLPQHLPVTAPHHRGVVTKIMQREAAYRACFANQPGLHKERVVRLSGKQTAVHEDPRREPRGTSFH